MRSALDQQFAANKAVDQVNTLIAQLTANVNEASSSITQIQNDLNSAQSSGSGCNDKILQLSNAKLKIETDIRTISD